MSHAAVAPTQVELLDILDNPARVSEADMQRANRLLKKWFPRTYNLRLEHQEMEAWMKAQGLEIPA